MTDARHRKAYAEVVLSTAIAPQSQRPTTRLRLQDESEGDSNLALLRWRRLSESAEDLPVEAGPTRHSRGRPSEEDDEGPSLAILRRSRYVDGDSINDLSDFTRPRRQSVSDAHEEPTLLPLLRARRTTFWEAPPDSNDPVWARRWPWDRGGDDEGPDIRRLLSYRRARLPARRTFLAILS